MSARGVSAWFRVSVSARATSRCLTPRQVSLGRAPFGDGLEAVADLGGVGADIVQARQLREALEAEDTPEARRRAIADGAARAGIPAPPCDEPAFQGVCGGRVGGAAAESSGVRPRTGPAGP